VNTTLVGWDVLELIATARLVPVLCGSLSLFCTALAGLGLG
jgi:hypothetical protein